MTYISVYLSQCSMQIVWMDFMEPYYVSWSLTDTVMKWPKKTTEFEPSYTFNFRLLLSLTLTGVYVPEGVADVLLTLMTKMWKSKSNYYWSTTTSRCRLLPCAQSCCRFVLMFFVSLTHCHPKRVHHLGVGKKHRRRQRKRENFWWMSPERKVKELGFDRCCRGSHIHRRGRGSCVPVWVKSLFCWRTGPEWLSL